METARWRLHLQQVPEDGAIIFDGMAVIQAMQARPSTFGEVADTILQYIVKLALQNKVHTDRLCD